MPIFCIAISEEVDACLINGIVCESHFLVANIAMQVYDAKQVIGLLHSENIPVMGEIYDVQVDINYPKNVGLENGDLEFGSCRVYEEQKVTMNVRNRGKYSVEYQ